jgi:molybdate transport system ATP-binding protein
MSLDLDIHVRREHFSLEVQVSAPAGVTVIFGPSGCGKTTLLRAVAGLEPVDHGKIVIDGSDMTAQPAHRRAVGYLFQEPRLLPHLNVLGNLKFAQRMGRQVRGQSFDEVIALLELDPLLGRAPFALSGGEAQRVALGRALLSAPKCLCLDEPLSALDQGLKHRILPYLERLRAHTYIPILYVTHDATEMARLADHIVLMQAGRSVLSGPAEAILSNPAAVPYLGVRAAGTVISGQVMAPDPTTGLAVIGFNGGQLILPELSQAKGHNIRIRIPAQDIVLARERPRGLSALNVFEGTITQLHSGQGPGVMVQFKTGDTLFLARVTQYSAQKLELAVGQTIFAIVKATAFDPAGIGT